MLVSAVEHESTISIYVCMLSPFSCVRHFETPWTVARQAPLSMEFSRQEYWNGTQVLYHQHHLGSPCMWSRFSLVGSPWERDRERERERESISPTPPSHPLGHHRAWSWVPCAIEQLPLAIYTHRSVSMSMLLSQFVPSSPSPIPFTFQIFKSYHYSKS